MLVTATIVIGRGHGYDIEVVGNVSRDNARDSRPGWSEPLVEGQIWAVCPRTGKHRELVQRYEDQASIALYEEWERSR